MYGGAVGVAIPTVCGMAGMEAVRCDGVTGEKIFFGFGRRTLRFPDLTKYQYEIKNYLKHHIRQSINPSIN